MMIAGCNCSMPHAIGAAILMGAGLWLLVAGVGTQWAAPTAVNAVVVGYYVAGFFVTLFGKALKHQAGAECKVHGRR